jgi:aminomethyltransferase
MLDNQQLKRTPLYDEHLSLGGKIVPFAGWELPVEYSGLIGEHRTVRAAAGIFDVSHMGEIWVSGKNAAEALDFLTCNDVKNLAVGRAQYNAIINEQGGVVDDIIIYRFAADRFFVCVNASNADKDFAWLTSHNPNDAQIENVSSEFGQIAVQGPLALQIVEKTLNVELRALSYFSFREERIGGDKIIIARTGYTGEDGFELFVPWGKTVAFWKRLLEVGKPLGIVPTGLGARDTLRLEACYPLHGHELGDDISAIESGLGWIVKLNKGEFIGRPVLEQQKKNGAPRSLVGFSMDDPGIARHGYKVHSETGQEIGSVTSGNKTPTLNRSLGLALIDSQFKAVDTKIEIVVRDKKLKAHVVPTPFYKRTLKS